MDRNFIIGTGSLRYPQPDSHNPNQKSRNYGEVSYGDFMKFYNESDLPGYLQSRKLAEKESFELEIVRVFTDHIHGDDCIEIYANDERILTDPKGNPEDIIELADRLLEPEKEEVGEEAATEPKNRRPDYQDNWRPRY